jgi:hypothetical protein
MLGRQVPVAADSSAVSSGRVQTAIACPTVAGVDPCTDAVFGRSPSTAGESARVPFTASGGHRCALPDSSYRSRRADRPRPRSPPSGWPRGDRRGDPPAASRHQREGWPRANAAGTGAPPPSAWSRSTADRLPMRRTTPQGAAPRRRDHGRARCEAHRPVIVEPIRGRLRRAATYREATLATSRAQNRGTFGRHRRGSPWPCSTPRSPVPRSCCPPSPWGSLDTPAGFRRQRPVDTRQLPPSTPTWLRVRGGANVMSRCAPAAAPLRS